MEGLLEALVLEESGAGLPWPSVHPDAFMKESRYEISIHAVDSAYRNRAPKPVSATEWTGVLDLLEAGSLRRLFFQATRPLGPERRNASVGSVSFDMIRQSADEAHYVSVTLLRKHGVTGYRRWQDSVVTYVTDAAKDIQAVAGVVTVDTDPAPHERSLGITPTEGRRHAASTLRSYAWGNVLSMEHLDALGGLTFVLTNAPVFRTMDISSPASDRAFLQLTPTIDSFSDAELKALKEFLGPVLTPADAGRIAEGPQLRIV